MVIVAYALQLSNEMLNTSKTYKVELALAIVRKLIDSEVKDHGQRAVIHVLVESAVPTLLNTIEGMPNILNRLFTVCKCLFKCKK